MKWDGGNEPAKSYFLGQSYARMGEGLLDMALVERSAYFFLIKLAHMAGLFCQVHV